RRLVAGQISLADYEKHVAAQSASRIVPNPALAVTVDIDRRRRCGFPEVVFGPGKTIDQLCQIVATLVAHREPVLATRIDEQQAAGLLSAFPQGRYNEVARTFRLADEPSVTPSRKGGANVAVISAGTGDLPVAEEARETLDW